MAINSDFPDPSFVQDAEGAWYAFSTNGNGKRVQVARSQDFNTWTLLDIEALPTLAGWETEIDHWAPDVIRRVCSLLCFSLACVDVFAERWLLCYVLFRRGQRDGEASLCGRRGL